MWCGVTAEEIIGPYFFEDDAGNQVTVTGDRYREMLQNFLQPWVAAKPHRMWFQQDGATAHTARDTLTLLQGIFGNQIISRSCEIQWPPRSPDLTAPDFFLWGYLKEKVYANKPNNIEELKANIEAEIRAISPQMLQTVMENVLKRAEECEAANGAHLENIIFA